MRFHVNNKEHGLDTSVTPAKFYVSVSNHENFTQKRQPEYFDMDRMMHFPLILFLEIVILTEFFQKDSA